MTQTNNEREALLDKLLAEYWDIAYSEGNSGLWHGEKAQSTLNDIRELFRAQSPISQNEPQEAVAWQFYQDGDWWNGSPHNNHKQNTINAGIPIRELYTSPPKQAIPDGWKPIETVPKDGTQVIINCSGGRVATAFYDGKPFVGEGWHVVVPFLGGFGSGTDTFIYFQEDMPTHWMPLPSAPTNTEVGE